MDKMDNGDYPVWVVQLDASHMTRKSSHKTNYKVEEQERNGWMEENADIVFNFLRREKRTLKFPVRLSGWVSWDAPKCQWEDSAVSTGLDEKDMLPMQNWKWQSWHLFSHVMSSGLGVTLFPSLNTTNEIRNWKNDLLSIFSSWVWKQLSKKSHFVF